MKTIPIAALLAMTSLAWLCHSAPAAAATCRTIIYYADAAHTRSVGAWSNCPGRKGLSGRRSPYYEVETEEIAGGGSGPGRLPCEFLEKGCSPVPTPRH
jgi:hypothetical protein